MKWHKFYILIVFGLLVMFSCEKEEKKDEEPEKRTVSVTFHNDTDLDRCVDYSLYAEYHVSFLVSYDDVQLSVENISPGGSAFGNVRVTDGQNIDVDVIDFGYR